MPPFPVFSEGCINISIKDHFQASVIYGEARDSEMEWMHCESVRGYSHREMLKVI